MLCNQNEKYLLKFISSSDGMVGNRNLLDIVQQLGIKLVFKNSNPVYQIIDELNYSNLKIGK